MWMTLLCEVRERAQFRCAQVDPYLAAHRERQTSTTMASLQQNLPPLPRVLLPLSTTATATTSCTTTRAKLLQGFGVPSKALRTREGSTVSATFPGL